MKIFDKVNCPVNFKCVILALIFVVTVTTISMGAAYDVALKNVTLVNIDEFNGVENEEVFNTRKATIKEFFEEVGIVIGENDVINKSIDSGIFDEDVLIIRRGRVLELTADGKVEFLTVTKSCVGDALEEAGVIIGEEDVITPSRETYVTDRMSVNVDRYKTEYVSEIQDFEFMTKRVADNTLESGKTVIVTKGENGEKEIKYLIKTKNGDIISKEYISEKVVKEATTEVIHVGAKDNSKARNEFTYKKKIEVKATAYDKSLTENGGNSKTAYGLTPQRGIVAVDPKVIPLGTKLYIESADGGKSWSYGYCIAGDTGGAIKGNKVDLCFDTQDECIQFGRRNAVVYILQ